MITKTTPDQHAMKCMVAGHNSQGEPDFWFLIVVATEDQIATRQHHNVAFRVAAKNGLDGDLVYDNWDTAGKALASLFEWGTASVYEIAKGTSE